MGTVPRQHHVCLLARSLLWAQRPQGGGSRRCFEAGLPAWSRGFRVAIVGRPNVGKSSMFNRLCGKQLAIAYDKPGTTRDSIEGTAVFGGLEFQVTDTAGLDDGADLQGEDMKFDKVGPVMAASGVGRWPTHLLAKALARTQQVVQESDLVLFLVDAKFGLTPVDISFARLINKQARPALLVANKAEGNVQPLDPDDMRRMGMGAPLYCSVVQNEGLSQLIPLLSPLVTLHHDLSAVGVEAVEAKIPRVLILGRPNVGKSTLVNTLVDASAAQAPDAAAEDPLPFLPRKVLVGPEPGVTRDPVSVLIYHKHKKIQLIDTAGLRRKSRVGATGDAIDIKTSNASLRKLRDADVGVLMLDAAAPSELLSAQDLIIANHVIEMGKALVIAVNKTDVLSKAHIKTLIRSQTEALADKLPQIGECPVVMISAEKKVGLGELMEAVLSVHDGWRMRIPSSSLIRWLTDLKRVGKMSGPTHPRPKFARQVDTGPPLFVILCTREHKKSQAYEAFLRNSLRETFGLNGVPFRIILRDANAASREPQEHGGGQSGSATSSATTGASGSAKRARGANLASGMMRKKTIRAANLLTKKPSLRSR